MKPSQRLRHALNACPMSLSAIGRATGIDAAVLSRVSRGRWIGKANFDKLAKYLGLRLCERERR